MATVSLPTLFAEPRVGKARVGKLEGNSRSHRNWRRVDSLQTGAAAKGVSQVGLVYIYRTHRGPWPGRHTVIRILGAVSDLSCCIAVQRHPLQDVGREGMRA